MDSTGFTKQETFNEVKVEEMERSGWGKWLEWGRDIALLIWSLTIFFYFYKTHRFSELLQELFKG